MTNKEKYINNASNEELSLLLGYGAILKDNKLSTPLVMDIDKRYNYDEKVKLAQNSKDIQDWLSQETEITADEMFEKLDYVKMIENDVYVRYELFVDGVSCGKISIYKTDYSYTVRLDNNYFRISPGLDKAIHKKIEELKN